MRRLTFATAVLLVVAVLSAGAGPVAADTIHLRNGRLIHSVDARIDDGHVVFWQFGSRQAIPLAVVERIVEDATRGPGSPDQRAEPGPEARAGTGSPRDSAGDRRSPKTAGNRAGGAASPAENPGVGELGGLDLATLAGLAGLGDDGGTATGVDPDLARGALRSLGAGGIVPLAARLGALGGGGAAGSGELGALLEIVPSLRALGEVMASDDPSPGRTAAAARDLLRKLSEMGVTEEMIRAEAARLGISLEGFTFPRR